MHIETTRKGENTNTINQNYQFTSIAWDKRTEASWLKFTSFSWDFYLDTFPLYLYFLWGIDYNDRKV